MRRRVWRMVALVAGAGVAVSVGAFIFDAGPLHTARCLVDGRDGWTVEYPRNATTAGEISDVIPSCVSVRIGYVDWNEVEEGELAIAPSLAGLVWVRRFDHALGGGHVGSSHGPLPTAWSIHCAACRLSRRAAASALTLDAARPSAGERRAQVGASDQADVQVPEGTYNADDMQLAYRVDAFYEQFADVVADPRRYFDYEFSA